MTDSVTPDPKLSRAVRRHRAETDEWFAYKRVAAAKEELEAAQRDLREKTRAVEAIDAERGDI